jgi:outer membrane protein
MLSIYLLNTIATVNATTALEATVDADVDINPFIAGIGFGMRF